MHLAFSRITFAHKFGAGINRPAGNRFQRKETSMTALRNYWKPAVRVSRLKAPNRNNTYICGWLIEHRGFLSVIEEATLVKIFVRLVDVLDHIADELNVRYGENGLSGEQEMVIRRKSHHLQFVCENLGNYGFLEAENTLPIPRQH
jgi:hypothetical protein